MPHAKRRRDQVILPAPAQFAKFVHYTSAESALKIINTKRLWMRNAVCMADFREVQHGFSILQRFFSEPSNSQAFNGAFDKAWPGAAGEAINLFNKHWTSRLIQLNTFIASVSEHDERENQHGRLSMWRAFGGNTARVAIVFAVPPISEGADAMLLRFSPVAYLSDAETNALIPEVIANVSHNIDVLIAIPRQEMVNWIFSMLLWCVTCIKHEGFKEEREWRVVHCPRLFTPSPLIESSTEIVAGTPQVVFKLPLDKRVNPILADLDFSTLFDRLIIGPSPYPTAMLEAYLAALLSAGVEQAQNKIFVSNIPIRSNS